MRKTLQLLLLGSLFLLSISTSMKAQCGAGTTEITVTTLGGSFDSESSWQLFNITTGLVEFEMACGSFVAGTTTLCLTDGDSYQILTFDDWGDGWNGGQIQVSITEDGTVNGCPAQSCEVISSIAPPTASDGDGSAECISQQELTLPLPITGCGIGCPACPDPSGVTPTGAAATSVNVGWTTGGSATSTTVWVCPSGTTPPDASCIEVLGATSPQAVFGLSPCSDFVAFVQEICGGDMSGIVSSSAFSTSGTPVNLTPSCGEVVTYPICPGFYGDNELITWTLCPDPGMYAKLTFTYVDLETSTSGDLCWDELEITSPLATSGPVCGEPDGDGGVGTGLAPGDCFFSTQPDDCITVEFDSDVSNGETGFSFFFECDAALPTGCATALPVELISFEGQTMKTGNKLNWQTATEEAAEWHLIERSVDGNDNWVEIGRIAAAGYTSENLSYSFMDEKPLSKAYYRLNTMDFSRSSSFSQVVSLERKTEGFTLTSAFPNPTKHTVQLQFNSLDNSDLVVTIMDISGKRMKTINSNAQHGINTLDLDLSAFAAGTYFVELSNGHEKIVERIVRQ